MTDGACGTSNERRVVAMARGGRRNVQGHGRTRIFGYACFHYPGNNQLDHALYERAVELLEAELGDELVALDEKGGNCFGFNGVATSVWQLLAVPSSFEAIHSKLLSEYEVDPDQCASELRVLLVEMAGLGLIRSVPVVAAVDRD